VRLKYGWERACGTLYGRGDVEAFRRVNRVMFDERLRERKEDEERQKKEMRERWGDWLGRPVVI
jgi:hypothetical protein